MYELCVLHPNVGKYIYKIDLILIMILQQSYSEDRIISVAVYCGVHDGVQAQ